MEYQNFFENHKEAQMRLQSTVVLYDGSPVEIICIANHPDGILRAFIRPTGYTPDELATMPLPSASQIQTAAYSSVSGLNTYMEAFIKDNPTCGIIRKHLNSPLFNKFRPFELGMYWDPPYVYYAERQPTRRVEQGLTVQAVVAKKLTTASETGEPTRVDIFGPEMKRCILGQHPGPGRCLEAINDDKLDCRAAAFHRHFALVKGPISTLFLAYKNNVIGQLPNGDYSRVKLGKQYSYCREAVEDLHLFNSIQ